MRILEHIKTTEDYGTIICSKITLRAFSKNHTITSRVNGGDLAKASIQTNLPKVEYWYKKIESQALNYLRQ